MAIKRATVSTVQEQSALPSPPPQATARSVLKIKRGIWTDEYIGTSAQLIEARILKEGQFPGDPGRGKTMASYEADGKPIVRGARYGSHGAGFRQVRRISRTLFNVAVRVEEEEGSRRLAEERARIDSAKLGTDAQNELKRQMERLKEFPETPKQYAKQAADLFWTCIQPFFHAHCGAKPHESGFNFGAADAEDFREMASGLYWAIRETAPKFDADHRLRKIAAVRISAAKTDLPLQRLLRAAAQQDTKRA